MKSASFGRMLFGASAAMFGVICLMWHDAETWQSLHFIVNLPAGAAIGGALMVALIPSGLALPFPKSARAASLVLGIVFALFSLACIRDIVKVPNVYFTYGSFFEQFSMLCGALAVYAMTEPNATRAALLRRLARLGLGFSAVSFTVAQIVYPKITAALVPMWIPPSQMFWTILTTIAFGLAAIALLLNVKARLAARLLALMLVFFGLLVWLPLVIMHPQTHNDWSEFALNALIAGACWVVADSLNVEERRAY
jgi:hypothetical protein